MGLLHIYIPTIDMGFEWEIIWEHMRYSGITTIQPTKWWYNGNIWDIISNMASWEIPELNGGLHEGSFMKTLFIV